MASYVHFTNIFTFLVLFDNLSIAKILPSTNSNLELVEFGVSIRSSERTPSPSNYEMTDNGDETEVASADDGINYQDYAQINYDYDSMNISITTTGPFISIAKKGISCFVKYYFQVPGLFYLVAIGFPLFIIIIATLLIFLIKRRTKHTLRRVDEGLEEVEKEKETD